MPCRHTRSAWNSTRSSIWRGRCRARRPFRRADLGDRSVAVTTSASVTSTVYAKIIERLVIAYQFDSLTAAPFFRYKNMENQPSAVASFPRYNKDSMPAVATETTSLTPTTWTYTNVDVTVSRIGVAREITQTAI